MIIFYSNTHKSRNNSRKTLTGSWIRSRKLNQLSTRQKINFKCTFCVFSFTPMSKCRKRPWKVSQVSETFPRNIRPSSFFSPFSVVRPIQIFGIFKKKKKSNDVVKLFFTWNNSFHLKNERSNSIRKTGTKTGTFFTAYCTFC